MKRNGSRASLGLAIIVLLHLVISVVHGMAHTGAHVPLSAPANAFVLIVILAGPLVGLALTWPAPRIGAWVVGTTMAGALIFGLVNHFVVDGSDHVAHIDPQWRALFTATAVLLVLTEALGCVVAIRSTTARRLR